MTYRFGGHEWRSRDEYIKWCDYWWSKPRFWQKAKGSGTPKAHRVLHAYAYKVYPRYLRRRANRAIELVAEFIE